VTAKHGLDAETRRDRLALVGELVGDVSHECNNHLAFILSNLQNLAEYADELARLVAMYRDRVKAGGLRDAALAKLEADMDLDFVLEDAGRAAREGLEGAVRLRDVLRTLSRLGNDEPQDPQLIDLAKTVRHAVSFETKTVALRAQLSLEILDEAPAFASAALVTRSVIVLVKAALTAFGERDRAENTVRVALERGGGCYAIRVEHNGGEPTIGIELAEEAARIMKGMIVRQRDRATLYLPEPDLTT
jgi:signal transduction histidine kinase